MIKKIILLIGLINGLTILGNNHKVDLLIHSRNRPMQLYSCLESIKKYCTNMGEITIVWQVSNEEYKKGYEIVQKDFPEAQWLQQKNKGEDFKQLTDKAVLESPNSYFMLSPDDMVVLDSIDLAECTKAMEKYEVNSFYLRLGKNTTYCYTERQSTPVPSGTNVTTDLFKWTFKDGKGDWKFPINCDMTIYRKEYIAPIITDTPYDHTNFEGNWNRHINLNLTGLCFNQSKSVSVCINGVKRNMEWTPLDKQCYHSPENLLNLFLQGYKLNIAPLHLYITPAAHMEYDFAFEKR